MTKASKVFVLRFGSVSLNDFCAPVRFAASTACWPASLKSRFTSKLSVPQSCRPSRNSFAVESRSVTSSSLAWPSKPLNETRFSIFVQFSGVAVPAAVIVLPVVLISTANVLVVTFLIVTVWPFSVAASAPVRPARVTTSPLDRPWAADVRIVGKPSAMAVSVLAAPAVLEISSFEPCAEIAVDGMLTSSK
ncbi:hypothetical protein D3C81_1155810 [compost metagenome]